jgi:GH43 family beta-xylosidase
MTVDEINVLTQRAKSLPPSGDQTHVLVDDGEDPWVISHEGNFYYCTVDRPKQKILISRFSKLEDMATARLVQVWPGNQGTIPEYLEIWSPELQLVDGKWYIYFALYNGRNAEERMYVLEGISDDPQGEYLFKGKLKIPTDRWAIDGSVLIMPDNEKYFIWSGWEGFTNISQNIYIAKMSNPWSIASDRVCISRPEYDWEKNGYPYVNEGPQALIYNGRVFIIYSASGSWTDDYCLGQLTYLGGDPLNPVSWRKELKPVFSKIDTIFAPGHASFVKLGDQDYIIYHAARSSQAGWARQIRAKPFTWNEDGSPNFGRPE